MSEKGGPHAKKVLRTGLFKGSCPSANFAFTLEMFWDHLELRTSGSQPQFENHCFEPLISNTVVMCLSLL